MPTGYADIIFFAAVAAFLIIKLISVLGRKDSEEQISQIVKKNEEARIANEELLKAKQKLQIPLVQKNKQEAEPEIDKVDYASEEIKQTVDLLKTKDPLFNVNNFVTGAETAFDMIMKAFSENDRNTLKTLLSPEIYNNLSSLIDRNITNGRKEERSVVSITGKEVTAAELSGTSAKLRLKFVSEQISVVKDANNNVISGSTSKIETVEDSWEFERNIKSTNPNWVITSVS